MKRVIKSILTSLVVLIPFHGVAQENAFFLGQAAYEQKNYIKACEYLESHQKLYPKHLETKVLKAKCELQLMQFDKVLVDLENVKISSDNELLLIRARALAGKGNYLEAIKSLETYKNTSNKISEQIILSFKEFVSLKKLPEWELLWSDWKYSDKESEMNNIRYAFKSEKYAEATDRLDGFIQKYSSNSEAFYLRGTIYLRDNDFKNALDCFESAVNLDKDNPDYLLARASALNKVNRSKKALEEYDLLIEGDSLQIIAYLGRAKVYLELENYPEALKDIGKFRKYYPQDIEALNVEAKANVKTGDYLSAIGEYGRLIKADPGRPEYFIGRADAYSQTKTYAYAVKDYSMALDLDPKNIEVYKKKARALQLSGDINGACTDWGHAARLGDVESLNMIRKYCKNQK
jgi:tetratricopeptide (TPR) repeat protein